MEKLFRTIKGQKIDVRKHVLEVLKQHPNAKIHVGTDSQSRKGKTYYCTVISFRYGYRGVHYLYTTYYVKRIRDMWSRLWKEVEDTLEVAQWLRDKVNVNITIDLDFNSDEFHDSNKLVSAGQGMATGLGFVSNIKPEATVACKAADHEVRRYIKNRRK